MTQDDELYFISMAAKELGMHPQTLRKYERLGLIQPTRTIGSVRIYSRHEIDRLPAVVREHDGWVLRPEDRAACQRRQHTRRQQQPHDREPLSRRLPLASRAVSRQQ